MEFLVIGLLAFGFGALCGIFAMGYALYELAKTQDYIKGEWVRRE